MRASRDSVWARAQAVVSDAEMDAARAMPLEQVRDMAKAQIDKAKAAWSEASKLTWWGDGLLPNYLHWKPYKDVIANAEMNFDLGEKEPDGARRKELYVLSWRTARTAVDSIAREANLDRSYWSILAAPIVEKGKQALDDAKEQIRQATNTGLYATIAIAILFAVLQARK